ncbi:MAG: hypothetical protein ACYCQJ_05385 [Nitrososphaerales archaeon]
MSLSTQLPVDLRLDLFSLTQARFQMRNKEESPIFHVFAILIVLKVKIMSKREEDYMTFIAYFSRRGISTVAAIIVVIAIVGVAAVSGLAFFASHNTTMISIASGGSTTTVWQTTTVYSTVTDSSEIVSLQNQVSSLQSQVASDESQIANLQSQVTNLNAIINIQDSTAEFSSASVSWPLANSYSFAAFAVNYAGYVVVTVSNSNDYNTQAQITWSNNVLSFSDTIKTGTSGSATFVVLPSTNVQVSISDQLGASGYATVSVTYYY